VLSAGHAPGDDLLAPDDRNPAGFFESRSVNAVNEALLAPHDDLLAPRGYSRPLRHGERWLAALPADVCIEAPAELRDAMRRAIPDSPYCCKDPRFGYTLETWRPLFGEALFVCVFRHPIATAASITRDVRYGDLSLDADVALQLWQAIYTRVLERYSEQGDWLFVHYDQLLDGTGVDRLARALGAPLDPELADPRLRRSTANGRPPAATAAAYDALCAAAGYRP